MTPTTDHQRFWSPVVRTLTPYVPGEQPRIDGLIKLNTNEHPLGPAPGVLTAIRAAADDSLRLYPDPDARALKEALAQLHSLQPAQVFVGNGSDEVLAMHFSACSTMGGRCCFRTSPTASTRCTAACTV